MSTTESSKGTNGNRVLKLLKTPQPPLPGVTVGSIKNEAYAYRSHNRSLD